MTRRFNTCAIAVSLGLACPALAQSATVTVSHNDPDGLVDPGQVITVRVDLSWLPVPSLAGLAGDLLPTPSRGSSANITSALPRGPLVQLGTPIQGGVVGIAIRAPSNLSGPIVAFEWTAPLNAPGPVTFAFIPSPATPNVRIFPASGSQGFVEAQTTFISASLTVVPSPATVAVLGAGLLLRRRTR